MWRAPLLAAAWVLALGGSPRTIKLATWTAAVDPDSLAIQMRVDGEEILAAAPIAPISARGLSATITARGDRLVIRIVSSREQTLDWPVTGASPQLSALILPEGEGLFVPFDQAAWRKRLSGNCYTAHGNLSMPFWAFQTARRTITYHAPTDLRTEVCLQDQNGQVQATGRHRFLDRDRLPAYEVEIWPGGPSPIHPALEYRQTLPVSPLTAKIAANPQAAKLLGAIHMYVWGDGRAPAFVSDLRKAGVERAWIGFDQGEARPPFVAGKELIDAAIAAGFLVGPYDTYSNAQDPATADSPTSRWPAGLYPAGCVVDANARRRSGFAGRGCELSSEALERLARKPLAERLNQQLEHAPNSYFLDVDAFGELHDDHAPAHPMTVFRDRENRLARLRDARARGVVLGSEHGVAWSVPVLDFGHGGLSVQNAALWARKKELGRWWPPQRPGVFFQPVELGPEFAAAKYDPAFRLPLFQAAFHDALVSTDRWDVPLAKFPSLLERRLLLELLYGAPSIWAMDRRQFQESRPVLDKLLPFFTPLHREIGILPLTSFEWLTPDRLVQRTTFGRAVTLTANFGTASHGSLGPGCVEARWRAAGKIMVYCP